MRISNFTQTYLKLFPIDWIDKLDWTSDEKSKESFMFGRTKIETFIEDSFKTFTTSALSGEYVVKDLNPCLDELRNSLMRDYPPIMDNNPFKEALYKSSRDLESDLLLVSKNYKALIKSVDDKISRTNHDYIISAFSTSKRKCSNELLDDIIHFCFPICIQDHFLKFTEEKIANLLLFREELSEKTLKSSEATSKIYKVIHDKCSFLLKKLMHIKGEAEYTLEFETRLLNRESINLNFLNRFDSNFSYLHVGENHRKDEYFNNWKKKCQLSTASFTECVLLMRFFVKNGGSQKEVESLLDDFHACVDIFNIKRIFDKYAINSLKNYMQNCYFSFLLSKQHIKFEDFKVEVDKIDNLQLQTKIYNFHPYEKAIEYLLNEIDINIKDGVDKKKILEKQQLLEKYYNKLKNAISWCQGQDYYPFQLPYWECLHKINDANIIVFIPSSFTRPLNYNALDELHSKYVTKIAAINEQIRIWDDKKEILELKQQLDSHQKTYIQILGLFTAILTFLFGTINIFSTSNNNISLQEKIDDTAVIGILLLIFSSIIYLFTSRKNEFFSFRNIMFLLMIVGYFFLLFKFY